MAHRQLAEDYRLKLKHANDRVFELESAIADQSYALEQLKSAEAPSAFTEQLESAHARIVELEETVTDLERRLKEALQEQTSSTALLQGCEADPMRGTDLVEQDFEAENKRSEELEEQLPDRDDEALCMDVDTATGAVRDAGPEISALREQVEMLKNHAAALEARLEEQNTTVTATTDAGQVVGSLRTQTLDLKNQLETYKTAETALRDQLARIGGKDAADAVYIDALKSRSGIIQLRSRLCKSQRTTCVRKRTRLSKGSKGLRPGWKLGTDMYRRSKLN